MDACHDHIEAQWKFTQKSTPHNEHPCASHSAQYTNQIYPKVALFAVFPRRIPIQNHAHLPQYDEAKANKFVLDWTHSTDKGPKKNELGAARVKNVRLDLNDLSGSVYQANIEQRQKQVHKEKPQIES